MKTKIELIKNYPIESLKNWGDYFGYPESICKSMIEMVSTTDWQNAKIAILDDFGFQMINFLINTKKVPLQNIYFLVSEADENKIELMKKWYSNFIENEVSSVYNINMSFDLIIANPPYGKQGTLSIPLINTFLKMHDKDMCILAPLNNFSKGGFLKFAKEIKYIEDQVFDVEICELCCAKLNRNFKGTIDKKDIVLKGKQLQLANVLLEYNKTHEKHWEKLTGLNRFDPEKKLSTSQNWKGFCKKDDTNLNAYNEGRVFVTTQWTPSNGVHKDKNAWDFKCNFEHIYPFGIGTRPKTDRIIDAFVFETKEEKDNFQNWWYSCLEGEIYNKNSLCNCILHIIEKVVSRSAGSEGYLTYFPNLDWSKSWTDTEILKELGLPEDFLEE